MEKPLEFLKKLEETIDVYRMETPNDDFDNWLAPIQGKLLCKIIELERDEANKTDVSTVIKRS
jgi:hypothetical protein